jgi:hypothetical protein
MRGCDTAVEINELFLTTGHLQYIFFYNHFTADITQSRGRGKALDIKGSEADVME